MQLFTLFPVKAPTPFELLSKKHAFSTTVFTKIQVKCKIGIIWLRTTGFRSRTFFTIELKRINVIFAIFAWAIFGDTWIGFIGYVAHIVSTRFFALFEECRKSGRACTDLDSKLCPPISTSVQYSPHATISSIRTTSSDSRTDFSTPSDLWTRRGRDCNLECGSKSGSCIRSFCGKPRDDPLASGSGRRFQEAGDGCVLMG